MSSTERKKEIYRVTIKGSIINTLLMMFKFAAGFIGGSSAMIADAVHSLSDFLTDIVVLLFVKISSRPEDANHGYGHGKYETLATLIISVALFAVGAMIIAAGVGKIMDFVNGVPLEPPGRVALVAAVLSIVLKEWTFRFTAKVGRRLGSQAVVANAWHHRSDALSSIGTAAGIGGAIFLGKQWAVLDPVAAVIVSFFIFNTAIVLIRGAVAELMEQSLPKEVEDEIRRIVENAGAVDGVHNLRTRRIGNRYAMEMHIRMAGGISLYEAHRHASCIERALRDRYGSDTHIGLHLEPLKRDAVCEQ